MLTRPQQASGLIVEEMGDEIVAFVPSSGRTVVLNAVGGAVLEFCDGKRSPAQIAAEIVAVLPADLTRVTEDVNATLDEYAALGLVNDATT
jgi:hypothetical protein